MKRNHEEPSLRVLEPTGKQLAPVRELTIYPSQFPILLRERMRGQSVAEVAEFFGIKPADVIRILEGTWRPSKEICRRMGLKVVYAIADQPGSVNGDACARLR
jgi:hypothetical protein